MKQRKSPYEAAMVDVISFEAIDIITTSDPSGVSSEDIKNNIPSDTWL